MSIKPRITVNRILIVCFLGLLLVGCADLFAPGLQEATDRLTVDLQTVSEGQHGLAAMVNEGQVLFNAKLDEAKASIETINFRSEEDKQGASELLASLDKQFSEFTEAAAAEAGKVDNTVEKLAGDVKTVIDDLAAANTPAEGISVLGKYLVPFLGPYAPVGEVALALFGLGGTARVSRKRGETRGITEVAAPIENARNTDLEDELKAKDPSRKYIVFDANLTKPQFDGNGVKAIIDSFSSLANRSN